MRARITYGVAAALFVAAACARKEQAPPPAAAQSPAPPTTVTIHAKDFAYVAPDSIPAGYVRFLLVNDGPSLHHATVVQLDSGKTAADLVAALRHPGPIPAWAVPLGGPNAPAPGDTTDATLQLAAGNYALLCFVDVPGGVPHIMKGMFHPFTVTPSMTATAAPAVTDTIALADFTFKFSKPLTAGPHTFLITNGATQPHEVEMVKLAPGKTAQDLLAWIQKPEGPPPALPIGGAAFEAPGKSVYWSTTLTAGNYLFVCFVPDVKDGKPHFMHGMMMTQKID